ncbi:MAG: 4Fe-4S binding protein [Sedimentisphaerales bacterium]|nr:4Fe-4S binding protein [Sedimentisphaerales bacterium]
MTFARALLIFSYGLFSIAAQTLLYREFITAFEGNDISVGIFFSTWFLWVGAGAIIVRWAKRLTETVAAKAELLFLVYLPAFVLQMILIIQAREIAGIKSYALWSIRDIVLVAILVNAPISLVTGILFPITCRWIELKTAENRKRFSVSLVYTLEAAGSFAGGIGMTILLGFGINPILAFFILAAILSLSVLAVQLTEKKSGHEGFGLRVIPRIVSFSVLLCAFLCIVIGVDKTLVSRVRIVKWTKLLPEESLTGSFQTPQSEYLYGTYQGQWVAVREGSVVETLPDESVAGRTAAIALCQNPDTRKVLVIGSGLGLCRQLLKLPQIKTVTWAHCDGDYVQKISEFIPPELRITDSRLKLLPGDIRSSLIEMQGFFDIVILNLPDATSSILNRYYTVEFYRRIKQSLSPGGLIAVRTTGGENIMGTELVNLGASTKLTLEKVFSKLVLTPGEETWFIASDSETITGEPGTLRDRFASIEDANNIFTPDALLSVYLPDRAATALERYAQADLPAELLVNHDEKPLTHLYSLLLAAKQSGAPAARLIKHFVMAGPLPFFIPILIFVLLRILYILKPVQESRVFGFDSSFLVFSTGAVGIGAVIVLMYLYQTYFGSLYLHIGVVSSLFMAGLTIGAASVRCLIRKIAKSRTEIVLLSVIVIHSLILCTIAFWPGEQWTHLTFAVAFVVGGFCVGGYFPIAAVQLADSGVETGRAGSTLETADHVGASVGGIVTSLALVPVLGAETTLFVFVALILANVPAAILRAVGWANSVLAHADNERVCNTSSRDKLHTLPWRGLGYFLFGVGVSVVLCSNLLVRAGAKLKPSLPQHVAQTLAGELRIEPESGIRAETAEKIDYFKVFDANEKLAGYVFSSQDLAPEVRGFGGKINLAVYLDDPNGEMIGFHIVRSNETPAYLELLDSWRDALIGRYLFKTEPFKDIHTVTGATISSEAILTALRTSGRRFVEEILNRPIEQETAAKPQHAKYIPDISGIYLVGAVIFALIVTYVGGFWSRLGILILTFVVGGLWLNVQFSSEQIVNLLSGQIPSLALSGVFLLVVGIPLIVLLFGNLYCGYICPFGAAQELVGYILPAGLKPRIQMESLRRARCAKYVVLLIVVSVFFISRDRTTLGADPLISVFHLTFTTNDLRLTLLPVVVLTLFVSLFYTRFWCLYLCPVGAFLSLLNRIALFKRYLPAKKFGRCSFGLTGKDTMDCIQCDKCRYDKVTVARDREQRHTPVLTTIVLAVAVFVSAVSISRFLQVIPAGTDTEIVSVTGGQPRDVDLQRVREMIRQKQLSDKEAEFYKKVE